MKFVMKSYAAAIIAVAAMGTAHAQTQQSEVYAKAGFLGAGVGYSHGINPNFSVRGDLTTAGSYTHKGSSSDFDYKAKLRNNVATVYGDWFPFSNGFRLSAGIGLRDTHVKAHARANSAGTVTIGDTTVAFDGKDDYANAKISLPTVTPYLGLGYGHNNSNNRTGFTFTIDAGVYFGKPKVNFDVSQSVKDKLGADADKEIEKQRKDIKHDARKLKVFPALYVGVGYRF